MLLARRLIAQGMIEEGEDGKYSISQNASKSKELNSLVLQTGLGGLRNEDDQNDSLRQAYERCDGGRAITFGIRGEQSVHIVLGDPAASVQVGEEMSVPVTITRTRPDGSAFTIEQPQESINFKDVKVLGPNGQVNYSYDEATSSIRFRADAAGKYSISAVGIALDTRHNQLLDTNTDQVEGVAKEVPKPTMVRPSPTRQELPQTSVMVALVDKTVLNVNADQTADLVEFFPNRVTEMNDFISALANNRPANAGNVLQSLLNGPDGNFIRTRWEVGTAGGQPPLIRPGPDGRPVTTVDAIAQLLITHPENWEAQLQQWLNVDAEQIANIFNFISLLEPNNVKKMVQTSVESGMGVTTYFKPGERYYLGKLVALDVSVGLRGDVKDITLMNGDRVRISTRPNYDVQSHITISGPLEVLLDVGGYAKLDAEGRKFIDGDTFARASKSLKLSKNLAMTLSAEATSKGNMKTTKPLITDITPSGGVTFQYELGKALFEAGLGYFNKEFFPSKPELHAGAYYDISKVSGFPSRVGLWGSYGLDNSGWTGGITIPFSFSSPAKVPEGKAPERIYNVYLYGVASQRIEKPNK
jgi:hypothetical protein